MSNSTTFQESPKLAIPLTLLACIGGCGYVACQGVKLFLSATVTIEKVKAAAVILASLYVFSGLILVAKTAYRHSKPQETDEEQSQAASFMLQNAQLQQERGTLETQKRALQAENTRLREQAETQKREVQSLSQTNAKLHGVEPEIRAEKARLTQENATLKNQAASWQAEKADFTQERTALRAEIERVKQVNAQVQQQLTQALQQQSILKLDNTLLSNSVAQLAKPPTSSSSSPTLPLPQVRSTEELLAPFSGAHATEFAISEKWHECAVRYSDSYVHRLITFTSTNPQSSLQTIIIKGWDNSALNFYIVCHPSKIKQFQEYFSEPQKYFNDSKEKCIVYLDSEQKSAIVSALLIQQGFPKPVKQLIFQMLNSRSWNDSDDAMFAAMQSLPLPSTQPAAVSSSSSLSHAASSSSSAPSKTGQVLAPASHPHHPTFVCTERWHSCLKDNSSYDDVDRSMTFTNTNPALLLQKVKIIGWESNTVSVSMTCHPSQREQFKIYLAKHGVNKLSEDGSYEGMLDNPQIQKMICDLLRQQGFTNEYHVFDLIESNTWENWDNELLKK